MDNVVLERGMKNMDGDQWKSIQVEYLVVIAGKWRHDTNCID